MSVIETTVESVLEQFANLDFKEQQKFAAAMTRHLQGAPAKKATKKAKKDDDEEKEKRPRSEAQSAWNALQSIVRKGIIDYANLEKLPQATVYTIASRFKEEGKNTPSTEEVVELYNSYMDAPWMSKTAKARSAKDGESVSSEKPKAEKPKAEKPKDEKPKAKKVVVEEEIEERAPIVVEKKDSYPAGSSAEDTPPMAFERKMLGGKKVKMSKKPWPAHCWAQDGGAYLGVWDEGSKTFDTDYDDPLAE